MIYVSFNYYVLIIVLLIFYYSFPIKYRWVCLLAGSIGFYYWVAGKGFWLFLFTLVGSYFMGNILYSMKNAIAQNKKGSIMYKRNKASCKICCIIAILFVLLPLLVTKNVNFVLEYVWHKEPYPWIVPLGISFYSLQIISYLSDIYTGKIRPQTNIFQYALFVSFFPQIIQGPIPRYHELKDQLYQGHTFNEHTFVKGLQLIIWGFFLKFMIANSAGVIVDTVFDHFPVYEGEYILVAGILYSLQLYTDFMSCVAISQGVSALFGIKLSDNFMHPYQATSIKEFWRRWHLSFSFWLRDYLYIPLGGNRKGRISKYKNLMITFAASGVWHGAGYKFLFWGLLHAFYQIAGEITAPMKDKIYCYLNMPKNSLIRNLIQKTGTFFLVMIGWIIFRARRLKVGLSMVRSIFVTYNPWIFFNDSLFQLGLSWKECMVLLLSTALLVIIEHKQEKICIRDWILKQHIFIRWSIYIITISVIWIYGTYGIGFHAQDFIYGGF